MGRAGSGVGCRVGEWSGPLQRAGGSSGGGWGGAVTSTVSSCAGYRRAVWAGQLLAGANLGVGLYPEDNLQQYQRRRWRQVGCHASSAFRKRNGPRRVTAPPCRCWLARCAAPQPPHAAAPVGFFPVWCAVWQGSSFMPACRVIVTIPAVCRLHWALLRRCSAGPSRLLPRARVGTPWGACQSSLTGCNDAACRLDGAGAAGSAVVARTG